MRRSARAASSGTTPVVVGVDIGGTGTRLVTASPTGVVLDRLTVATPQGHPADAVASLHDAVCHLASGRRPVAIGIGASGPIDADGTVRNPDTLPAFTGLSLADELAGTTTGPVVVDNDAVCAAIAERRVGAAQHARRSLHVTLGTGIGVCLLDGDTPYRLPDGTHPEAGHLAVTVDPAPCYCGRSACWEQIASRRRLQTTAARLLDRPDTDRSALADLADRASAGDDLAVAAFDDYGVAVASGLGTLLGLYGPDLVVLGGSAATHLPLFRRSLAHDLGALGRWTTHPPIIGTPLDDYAGAIGGVYVALDAVSEQRAAVQRDVDR